MSVGAMLFYILVFPGLLFLLVWTFFVFYFAVTKVRIVYTKFFYFTSTILDLRVCTKFITSLNSNDDLERGFSVGADDYIKKPFELKELEIRINNIN